MKKIIITVLVFPLFLVSCNNSTTDKKEQEKSPESIVDHNHSSDEIQLNHGKKWMVVPEMKKYLKAMENEINTFSDGELKDFKQLSDNLLLNIDSLTSNCTMQGQVHDELHKWLVPYIETVNEFSELKDQTAKEEKIILLQNSYVTFNNYFQ